MSREADGTKKRRVALARVHSFGVLLVLLFMLMWSKVAVCGEIHKAIKDNDSAKVRELIRNNPNLVFSRDGKPGDGRKVYVITTVTDGW